MSKGKKESALRELNLEGTRVNDLSRPKAEIDKGLSAAEIDAFQVALDEAREIGEGRWIELFQGTYLRRSLVRSYQMKLTVDLDGSVLLPAIDRCPVHQFILADISDFLGTGEPIFHLRRHQQCDGNDCVLDCNVPIRPYGPQAYRDRWGVSADDCHVFFCRSSRHTEPFGTRD